MCSLNFFSLDCFFSTLLVFMTSATEERDRTKRKTYKVVPATRAGHFRAVDGRIPVDSDIPRKHTNVCVTH